MKRTGNCIVGVILILLLSSMVSAQHYYGGGSTIPLKVDSTRVAIRFDTGLGMFGQTQLLAEIDRIVETIQDNHMVDNFVVCSLSTGDNYDDFLDSVQSLGGVYMTEPYYRNQSDSAFPVNLHFCVAFEESVSQSKIDSINASFGVVTDHEVEGMPNVFVLCNTDSSGYRMLDLANAYYNLSETRYSHPEFGVWIQKFEYLLYDYYHEEQWHIEKVVGDFNEASVWDFGGMTDTTTIAVIDDGVTSHEDLPSSRVLSGRDFSEDPYDNDPAPGFRQAHGMASAGIIAASHTTDSQAGSESSTGIISLNPNTLVRPVKIFDDEGQADPEEVTQTDVAAAITYAYTHGADVLSCSWGYGFTGPGGDNFDVISEAIEKATLFGRGGRGCPVIFAAGNAGFYGINFPAWLPSAFSVGATDSSDSVWYYSSYGSGLDIVAPSGNGNLYGDVWTLDQMNEPGFNPWYISNCPPDNNDPNYHCRYGGTSAAAPVVSGVASLLLARDSTLSAQAVYYILRNSAVTDLDWGDLWSVPDDHYGYGRVDAFRAILSIARGDVDNSGGVIDGADLSKLIDILFIHPNTEAFPSPLLGDVTCDGLVDGEDLSLLINHLFITYEPLDIPCFNYEYYAP